MKLSEQKKRNYEKLNLVKLNAEAIPENFALVLPPEASGIFRAKWTDKNDGVTVAFRKQDEAANGKLALVQLNAQVPYGVIMRVFKEGDKIILLQPENLDNPNAELVRWELTDAEKATFKVLGVMFYWEFALKNENAQKRELAEA